MEKNTAWPAAFLFLYAGLSVALLQEYGTGNSTSFILGVLVLPFTLEQRSGEPVSFRFALLAALPLLFLFWLPVKSLLYFTLGFSLLFCAETLKWRGGLLSACVLLLMSPLFRFGIQSFSFPIRLQLSHWVGSLFSMLEEGVVIRGNIIQHEGNEFAVDPACMGLSMLVTSLLLGVLFLGYFLGKEKKRLSFGYLLVYLTVVLVLNVVSNLIRMLLLVQFTVLPGAPAHDLIGLLCLLLYVVLPAGLLARFLVRSRGREKAVTSRGVHARFQPAVHLLLAVGVCLAAYRVSRTDTFAVLGPVATETVPGYRASLFAPGIWKLQHPKALVYVKYLRGFYDTGHNPTICWSGSGYTFGETAEETVAGLQLYTSVLQGGGAKLYTAWWYSNGHTHTNSEWAWRRNMMRGERDYAVVNVTAATREDLEKEIRKLLHASALNSLFPHQKQPI